MVKLRQKIEKFYERVYYDVEGLIKLKSKIASHGRKIWKEEEHLISVRRGRGRIGMKTMSRRINGGQMFDRRGYQGHETWWWV